MTRSRKQKRIIVVCGQSNAAGRANTSALSAANASYANSYAAVTLAQQLSTNPSDPITWSGPFDTGALAPRVGDPLGNNMGCELSLGRYLDGVSAGTWRIIKFAIDSSGLDAHWKPTATYPTVPTGGPNLCSQFISYCYEQVALSGLDIGCIVWIQGETDALTSGPANAYLTNLNALLTTIRAAFPDVPFVLSKLSTQTTYTYLSTVRTAQASFLAANTKTAYIDPSDLALQGDNIHYTADTLVTIGNRLGPVVLAQMGVEVPPVASFTQVASNLTIAFTDTSTHDGESVTAREWNFGDDGTSTAQNPSHTYTAPGTYTVTLDVCSGHRRVDRASTSLVVGNWAVDATSQKAVPASLTDWANVVAALGFGQVPTSLWLCQDTSGNLADAIGAVALTAFNAPSYRRTITNWSRYAVATINNLDSFYTTSVGDISSNSEMVLAYVALSGVPSVAKDVITLGSLGTNSRKAEVDTNGKYTCTGNGISTATATSAAGTTVHPVVLQVDRTGLRVRVFTDADKMAPTWVNPAGGTARLALGADSFGDGTTEVDFLYACRFGNTGAELTDSQVKSLLQLLGWTVSWS